MTTYRKIATVEAEQFLPLDNKIPSGVVKSSIGHWTIETLEGTMIVRNEDWICTGIDGEKWAVKDDIFKRTYERVGGVK